MKFKGEGQVGKMPVLVCCDFKHMIAKDNKIPTAMLILCDYLFQPCMLSVALLRLTHLPPLPSPLLQQTAAGGGCRRAKSLLFIPYMVVLRR